MRHLTRIAGSSEEELESVREFKSRLTSCPRIPINRINSRGLQFYLETPMLLYWKERLRPAGLRAHPYLLKLDSPNEERDIESFKWLNRAYETVRPLLLDAAARAELRMNSGEVERRVRQIFLVAEMATWELMYPECFVGIPIRKILHYTSRTLPARTLENVLELSVRLQAHSVIVDAAQRLQSKALKSQRDYVNSQLAPFSSYRKRKRS